MADAQDQHSWKAAAERARSVSEQWRALHEAEEARANEAHALAVRAAAGARRAEQERDMAVQRAEEAVAMLATAKQEQARWRARADAQTASKTFLLLEEARESIAQRDVALTNAQRALEALQLEFDAFKSAKKREAIEREATTRGKLESLRTKHQDALANSRELEHTLNRVRGELGGHLAASPPGAYEALKADCERMQAHIRQLEMKMTTMRREVLRWRERARGAIANERMLQLNSGPVSLPGPARANLEAALLDGSIMSGVASTPSLLESPSEAEEQEQLKLRTEVEYGQEELRLERERQIAFQHVLWAASEFTQPQKLKLMAWLRSPPEGAPASDAEVAAAGADGLLEAPLPPTHTSSLMRGL